jgi:hypothetical protein
MLAGSSSYVNVTFFGVQVHFSRPRWRRSSVVHVGNLSACRLPPTMADKSARSRFAENKLAGISANGISDMIYGSRLLKKKYFDDVITSATVRCTCTTSTKKKHDSNPVSLICPIYLYVCIYAGRGLT